MSINSVNGMKRQAVQFRGSQQQDEQAKNNNRGVKVAAGTVAGAATGAGIGAVATTGKDTRVNNVTEQFKKFMTENNLNELTIKAEENGGANITTKGIEDTVKTAAKDLKESIGKLFKPKTELSGVFKEVVKNGTTGTTEKTFELVNSQAANVGEKVVGTARARNALIGCVIGALAGLGALLLATRAKKAPEEDQQ